MKERIAKFFHALKCIFQKRNEKKAKQYTKTLITSLTVMACIWISTSYVYAGACLFMYGDTEYLSELSQQVCITILGTVVVYALKSFFETFSERKQDLEDLKFNHVISGNSDKEGGASG